MTKKINKTTTLSAQVAISQTESGMDYVQVLPDNPSLGLVQPFRGLGYGQLLSNGSFDFTKRKRIRRKPEKKTKYGSLTFGADGNDRYIFIVPSEMRQQFADILEKDAKVIADYLRNKLRRK